MANTIKAHLEEKGEVVVEKLGRDSMYVRSEGKLKNNKGNALI